jgi:(p)ppGpp synthase/HD superfamily hydrolase
MNIVKLALKIATKAHEGQFRWDKKTPYIQHPIAVAKLFKKEYKGSKWYNKNTPKIIEAICLLHDVLEDCTIDNELEESRPMTGNDLMLQGVPSEIVDAIECLTHQPFENYAQYIDRIKHHNIAIIVKRMDLKHNLSSLPEKAKTHKDKYLLALYILEH